MGKTAKETKIISKKIIGYRNYWPVLVIISLWVFFCMPFFIRGLMPFPSRYLVTFFPPWNSEYSGPVKNGAMPDVITQIYPWKYLTAQTWKSGNIPLWNPYSFSGTVQAGNYQSAVFSPFNFMYLLFPFNLAWSLIILIQPLLAGLFMYLLLKTYRLTGWATIIGSVAFMFSGFLVVWMAYGTLGYAALFLPLMIALIERETLRHSYINGILLSVCAALSLLSGHFQISIYVILAAFIYLTTKFRSTPRRTGFLLAYLLFGIGICLPQLLLTLDAYGQSVRSRLFLKGEVIPWQYLLTVFAPDFFGNPVTRNDWFGHYAEWASYVGVVPLFFAFRAAIDKWSSRVYYLFLAVGSILLAYDTVFVNILFALRIPVISTSAASRIIFLFSFSLSVMSAFGADAIRRDWQSGRKSVNLKITALLLFVIAGIWVTLLGFHLFEPDKIQIAKRNLILPTIFGITALTLLIIGYFKKRILLKAVMGLLILLCCYDSVRYASKWMPFDSQADAYPENKTIAYLVKNTGFYRIYGNLGGEACVRFGLYCIEGYDAMYQGRYGRFVASVPEGELKDSDRSVVNLNKNGKFTDNILRLLGVKYIVHRVSDGRNVWAFPYWNYDPEIMKPVYADQYYQVYEYQAAFPRVFLASKYIIAGNDDEIIRLINAKDTDLKENLILESKPPIEPASGNGIAEIISYKPNEVIIRAQSDAPKLLFLSDTYDKGWKVSVDGGNAALLRADYDFRAVSVPPGSHTIRFVYRPDSLTAGLIICGLSVIFIILTTFIWNKYENRHL
jgi:hypothetical protein